MSTHDTVTLEDGRVIELTPEYLDTLRERGWPVVGEATSLEIASVLCEPDDDDERSRLEDEIEETSSSVRGDEEEIEDLMASVKSLRHAVGLKLVRIVNLKARLAALPGERD